MKKTGRFIKSMTALCLSAVMLMGMGIQAKAEEVSEVRWTEGWSHIMQEGETVLLQAEVRPETWFEFYSNDVLLESGLISVGLMIQDGRYVECKLTPEGKRGIYIYAQVPAVPEPGLPPSPSPPSPAPSSPACSDHNYEWVTTREATATAAGEKAYQCTKCSHIESYAEVSGYLAFNEDAMKSIRNAAVNGTVTVDTKMWVSFHKSVFDTLGTRKDVAVTVNFKHEGKNYTTTIPAGADLTGLFDENGFSGFLNLMAKFGGSEIVK